MELNHLKAELLSTLSASEYLVISLVIDVVESGQPVPEILMHQFDDILRKYHTVSELMGFVETKMINEAQGKKGKTRKVKLKAISKKQ